MAQGRNAEALPLLEAECAKAPDDPANLKRYATIVPFVVALLDEDPRLYEHLLDPIGKPYPIEALGTHALGLTDVKKRAVLLNAVRRAVRYGGSTAARPVDRILDDRIEREYVVAVDPE